MVIKCLLVRANVTAGKQSSSRAPSALPQHVAQHAGSVPGLNNVQSLDPSTHDPNNFFLTWEKTPNNILVVKKPGADAPLVAAFSEVCAFLLEKRNRVVYVEEPLLTSRQQEGKTMKQDATFQRISKQLRRFRPDHVECNECINFIVCVGGDGTLIHVACQFQKSMPPVIAFSAGSLGFLTPFPLENCAAAVDTALNGDCHLILRSRIKCVICKSDSLCSRASHTRHIDDNDSSFQYNALNEVVVQRKGPFLSALDIYVDGKFVTCMQGDGIIISTATGSTAYSLAAGASMVHPSVPALLLTPICPHSLSFRPVVMPAGCDVIIMLSEGARESSAYVTVDGRIQKELAQGDSLRVTTSLYPLPSVCRKDPVTDWFDSLKVNLNWNQRPLQKPLVVDVKSSTSSVNLLDSNSVHSMGANSVGSGTTTTSTSRSSQPIDFIDKARSSSAANGSLLPIVPEPVVTKSSRHSAVAVYHRGNSNTHYPTTLEKLGGGVTNSPLSLTTQKSISHNDLPTAAFSTSTSATTECCPPSYIITKRETTSIGDLQTRINSGSVVLDGPSTTKSKGLFGFFHSGNSIVDGEDSTPTNSSSKRDPH